MSAEHYVIIGNGATANKAAEVIRTGDGEGRITLISDEFFPFYYRHLLCQYLTGDKEESELLVRPPSYYQEQRIRTRLGQTVVKVDFASRTLFLKHKEKVHYTALLLALGGRPRIPEVYYAWQHHFQTMKTLAEARALRKLLPSRQRILIVGGDMISIRLANQLLAKGKEVWFMIDRHAFWPLELSAEERQGFADYLRGQGATVLAGDSLVRLEERPGGGYKVQSRQGLELEVDLVGGFFGMVPNVEFLLGSGLDIEQGIIADEFLRTNIPRVYAAGDCAQVYCPPLKNYWVSVGWANAEHLGEVAGHNLLGQGLVIEQPMARPLSFNGLTVNTAWWRQF